MSGALRASARIAPPINRPLLFGYGLGSLGTGVFSAVPSVLLLYFMTNTLGVSAALAGLAVSLPKLLDVVIDPLVGSLSDRTRTRWGRRRPYLLAGALSMGATFVLLFAVPDFAEPVSRFWYVMIVFTISATAYSVFAVPYIAMPAEMSEDSHERTIVVSWRMAFALIGVLVGSAGAPALVTALGGGRPGYAGMSLVVGIFCALAMLIAFFAARKLPLAESVESNVPLGHQIKMALANKPFFILLGVYVAQLTGLGAFSAVVPYFTAYVLGQSEAFVGLIFLCLVGFAALSTLFWAQLAKHLGRRGAYGLAATIYACASFAILFLSAKDLSMMFGFIAVMGVGFGGMQVLPFSMITDTIQLDAERSGLRREGLFTGVWTAGEKAGLAFGPLVAGLLLSAFGFVESVGIHVAQPQSALFGIKLIACVAPALFLGLSLLTLRFYSLTEERLVIALEAARAARI